MCRGANAEIRLAAQTAGVYLWEIADRLGIQDYALSRKLRRELPQKDRDEILHIINDLSEQNKEDM